MRSRKEREKDKELKEYFCGYCGNSFKQLVGKRDAGQKRGVVVDIVRCPNCLNYLKTRL